MSVCRITNPGTVSVEPSRPTDTAPAVTTYTVESGDCLWNIAKACYGDGSRYNEIYEANKGTIGGNPDRIYPGQVLVIPNASGSFEVQKLSQQKSNSNNVVSLHWKTPTTTTSEPVKSKNDSFMSGSATQDEKLWDEPFNNDLWDTSAPPSTSTGGLFD